jgi:hypothetical protein
MQTAWKSAFVDLNDASGNEAYLTRASIFTTEPAGNSDAVTNEHPVRTKEFKDGTPFTKTSQLAFVHSIGLKESIEN